MFHWTVMKAKKLPSNPVNLCAILSSKSQSKAYVHSCLLRGHHFKHTARRSPSEISTQLFSTNSPFKCNHTKDAAIEVKKNIVNDKLSDIINELKSKYVRNEHRLTQFELKALYNRMKIQKPTAQQSVQILELCSRGRNELCVEEIVKRIWLELRSGNTLNEHDWGTDHYNFVLKFACERGNVSYTQTVFDEMTSDGTKPNVMSYEYLLAVHCKTGNTKRAKEILTTMDENQIPVSERAYNYMIQCLINSGTADDVNKMIGTASKGKPDHPFKINRDTLTTALNHYAKLCDVDNCQETIAFFESQQIELLNRDIVHLLKQFLVNGQSFDQCRTLFKYFKSDSEMQAALHDAVTSFVQDKQSVEFVKLIEKLVKDSIIINDIKPSIYKHLIEEMCRQNLAKHEFEAVLDLLESGGFTMKKNFECFKAALKSTSPRWIRKILVHMKANGMHVDEMSFEKLLELAAMGSSSSTQSVLKVDDVLDVIDLMCSDFEIQPSLSYIRDVIVPAMSQASTGDSSNSTDSAHIIAIAHKLRQTAILYHRIQNALINISLARCDFKTAIQLFNIEPCFYAKKFITTPLLKAYERTGDVQNFVGILEIICKNFDKIRQHRPYELTDAEIKQRKIAFVDEMLSAAVTLSLADDQRLTKLLEAFARSDYGLILGSNHRKRIQQQILETMDLNGRHSKDHIMQISSLLENFEGHGSSLSELAPIATHRAVGGFGAHLSAYEIKQMLMQQRAIGRDVVALEKALFCAYLNEQNVLETESMLSELSGKLNLTQANYAMLVRMYTNDGNLNEALNYLRQATKIFSTFKIHPTHLAQLITLMYDKGGNHLNMDEVRDLLRTHRPNTKSTDRNIPFNKLLHQLAANGESKYVQELFDALVDLSYIQPSLETAGPLITVHLTKRAYDRAVEKYQQLANTLKCLPMSGTLFKSLIQNKQFNLLQRARETHDEIYGSSATMSRLAFAYSECGEIDQAAEIFESNQIDDLTKDIGKVCGRYTKMNDVESTKLLLKSTDSMRSSAICDRRIIYETLLDFYQKYDMADAALELWLNMSNDNILPTPTILNKLSKLLRDNDIELPSDLRNKIERKN